MFPGFDDGTRMTLIELIKTDFDRMTGFAGFTGYKDQRRPCSIYN
jgi:hypothetical protein